MHPARRLPESMAPLGGDFSAKVAQANDRIICGSSVDAVKTVPMGRILARRLRIPFFQRRYCWGEPQWATLLRDVEACGGRAARGLRVRIPGTGAETPVAARGILSALCLLRGAPHGLRNGFMHLFMPT